MELGASAITFADGSKTVTDFGEALTFNSLPLDVRGGYPVGGNYYNTLYCGWHFAAGSPRGQMVNNMYNAYLDGYNNVALVASGTSILTVKNQAGGRSLAINIISSIYDGTDDTSGWRVYKGGTPVNSYTHSGGTLLHDSGFAARSGDYNTLVLATPVTNTDVIPPNTTVSYYYYGGVSGGSNVDFTAPYFKITFNSWI